MTDPSADRLDAMPLPVRPESPRPAAAMDLRARVHRRLGIDPPDGFVPMPKAVGLEYEVAGPPDGDPVLFLHAGTATAYAPLMTEPALADRHRLVRYHRRGYAGSDRFDGGQGFDAQVQDALRLLAHLDIERAHVVAHSGGGVIALELALDSPEVVRSLVLEEPAIHAIDPRWERLMLDAVRPALDLNRAGEARRAIERWMRGLSLDWRVELTRTVPGGPQQTMDDAGAFLAEAEDVVERWSFDHDRVARLAMPVLCLLAERRWPLTEAVAHRFAELVPQTEIVEIADAGHMLHTDQPERVASALAEFFARHRDGA